MTKEQCGIGLPVIIGFPDRPKGEIIANDPKKETVSVAVGGIIFEYHPCWLNQITEGCERG